MQPKFQRSGTVTSENSNNIVQSFITSGSKEQQLRVKLVRVVDSFDPVKNSDERPREEDDGFNQLDQGKG